MAAAYDLSTELVIDSLQKGVFVSGFTHRPLRLGQRCDEGATAGPSGNVETTTKRSKPSKQGGGKGQPQGKKGRGVTVQDLVLAGLLLPGRNKMSVQYKGTSYVANLSQEGQIVYQGHNFQSATAFSMYCKRLQTPNKQGDDGWKSVLYENQPLDLFRHSYQELHGDEPFSASPAQQRAAEHRQPEAEVPEEAEAMEEEEELADGTEEESDQWVHCDRCKTWRIVPDDHWPGVQNDKRSRWFCDYAGWDVRQYKPNTGPCQPKKRGGG